MNKKLYLTSLCILTISLFITIWSFYINTRYEISCTGTITMNSPVHSNYLFNGTISIILFPNGDGTINLFGSSYSTARSVELNKHILYRDISFNYKSNNNSTLMLSELKTIKFPKKKIIERRLYSQKNNRNISKNKVKRNKR